MEAAAVAAEEAGSAGEEGTAAGVEGRPGARACPGTLVLEVDHCGVRWGKKAT